MKRLPLRSCLRRLLTMKADRRIQMYLPLRDYVLQARPIEDDRRGAVAVVLRPKHSHRKLIRHHQHIACLERGDGCRGMKKDRAMSIGAHAQQRGEHVAVLVDHPLDVAFEKAPALQARIEIGDHFGHQRRNRRVDLGQGMANAAYSRQASANATDTRMRLEESVRVGFAALNSANAQIDAMGQAVEANTKVVSAFEEQYASGGRQLLDLLDAYERLYQAQSELARLLVSEATAGFLIRRQMGDLVDGILSRDNS